MGKEDVQKFNSGGEEDEIFEYSNKKPYNRIIY